MRMAVDLPAPFSPTRAWIVPGATAKLTRSLASTSPKRLVISRSSSMACEAGRLFLHRVRDLDLAADDLRLGLLDLAQHVRRDELLVVLVHGIAHAAVRQAVDVDAPLEAVAHEVGDDLVDGVVHPLDHAGEDEAGLDPVLIGVDADDVLLVLLGGVEDAQSRVAGGGEDDVRPLADLGHGQLLALARVVPRRLGDADVVLDHHDLRIGRAGPLLVADLELVDEGDVHAADEADDAGLGRTGGDHPYQKAPLVLLEDQGGDVRQLADAVDDGEIALRVVLGDRLDDG